VSSKSPFVKTTTAVIWSSRAVMRGGAMAQEQDGSMTCPLSSRRLRVLPRLRALPRTVEGRLEPQVYCHRPGTRRRSAAPVHSAESEKVFRPRRERAAGVRPSAVAHGLLLFCRYAAKLSVSALKRPQYRRSPLLRDRLPPRVVEPYAAAIPKRISETPRAAVSSKSPFVKTTTAGIRTSRAVMRGGAMAQE
jgi:hypothetical protein